VNDKTFLGRSSVIVFGYTSCPDVCPTTLRDVSNWLKALGTLADKLNVLFISIDPESQLTFTNFFHRLIPAYGD
jgi:protein SCO1